MKKIKNYILIGLAALCLSSCNNWLNVQPENEQVSGSYWTSKEEAQSVLSAGYVYLRNSVPSLIQWGELRAGSVYSQKTNKLQSFQVLPTDKALCNWGTFYQVINMANAVLKNVDDVVSRDQTFNAALANSYKTEAYFLRALSYFYIVRNWREAPLILEPYENDKLSYSIGKSTEMEIMMQIKADINAALATGAAREGYEKAWETKGRATKWALEALLADVCLWGEEYPQAVMACNEILNANSPTRPAFMLGTTEDTKWFTMFYPGNSNESIFEIQYSNAKNQINDFSQTLFGMANPTYLYSKTMLNDFIEETNDAGGLISATRALYGGLMVASPELYQTSTAGYVWKYSGLGTKTQNVRQASEYDCNFIIYRVAEIKLIKAEALIMQGQDYYGAALTEINAIRNRAGLQSLDSTSFVNSNEEVLLETVLKERNIELAAEGKRWYDLLRYGRRSNYQYRDQFISLIQRYNQTANPAWVRSVLRDENALFLPIWETELQNNTLLKQNPYYE